jgi:ribosomal protein S18 acetylase RimI-like enzyme
MKIKLLDHTDWQAWKELRLEALKNVPEAYGSSFEEESSWSDQEFQNCIARNNIFGAFDNEQLIGSVAFYNLGLIKTKHKGMIWGVYVKSEYRGRSIADQLMESVIAYAKSRILQLHLCCVTKNQAAISFYQKHGFKIYGTEPRSLKIDNEFYDEHLMALEWER